MKTSKPPKVERALIVTAAVTFGEVMPYISRIPLSFTYGTAWIWEYMPQFADVLRWNGGQLVSLIPVALFGLLFIYGNLKVPFVVSFAAHLGATSLIYYSHGKPYHPDDFLGCVVYPFLIGGSSMISGVAALVISLVINNWKRPAAVSQV